MLGDISGVENIFIVCGYTDMRKAIDGLCAVVEEVVKRDPRENSLFLFCGKRCDRIKALMYDGSGEVQTKSWTANDGTRRPRCNEISSRLLVKRFSCVLLYGGEY